MAHLLEPAQLLRKAVQLIANYDASVDTIDVYVLRALGLEPGPGEQNAGGLFAEDWVSLQQIMYGTQRMDKALRAFLNALYHVKAAAVSRQDYNMYKIMSYLIFFRLRELGLKKMVPLLEALDAAKMHTLLGFAMDREAFGKWVLENWCKFLDRGYIESEVLQTVEDHRAGLEAWLDKTHAQAWGGRSTKAGKGGSSAGEASDAEGGVEGREARRASHVKWTPTVPVAPKLTQPKARLPPEPIRIPQGVKAVPMPAYLDAPGHTLEDIHAQAEARKKSNAEQTAAKYHATGAPVLHETRRTVDRIRAEVEAAREAAMVRPAELGYRPPPSLPSKGADVAYTVAAVLREDATARAKAASEAQLLRDFEAGLRDSSEFYAWQEEEKAKDEAARLAAVEARKWEAEEAAVKLRQALEAKVAGNKIVAQAIRTAAAAADEHKVAEYEGMVALKTELAAAVRAREYTAPNAAKAQLATVKRQVVAVTREQRLDDEAAIAQARQEELAARAEVIRQIRALERVPRPHIKLFDPTTAAHELTLEAMSLVELRERLVLVTAKRAADEEEKRRAILRDKREAQEVILAKVEAMKARRAEAATRAAQARVSKLITEEERKAREERDREESALSLAERLAARKAARESELAELSAAQSKATKEAAFRAGTEYLLEETRLGQVLKAAERMADDRQSLKLREAQEDAVAQARMAKDMEIRRARESALDLAADKARALAVMDGARAEREERLAAMTRRKDAFFKQTVEEQALLDARDALNPYAGAVRSAAADQARASWGGTARAEQLADKLTRRIDRLPPGHPLSPNMTLKVAQARSLGRTK